MLTLKFILGEQNLITIYENRIIKKTESETNSKLFFELTEDTKRQRTKKSKKI